MALLTPNTIYEINGVKVCEKIIPDGTRWKDANKAIKSGFAPNALYKKQRKLTGDTGTVQWITIHNTNDLNNVEDDAEQYTRATYNENMGSARVHLYIDDIGGWQNLRMGSGLSSSDPNGSAEVGWHAGDGSVADGGNMTSIGIEVIMNDNAEHDAKAYDNSARITAWLLYKHNLPVSRVVTHTYWVNKSVGKHFDDVDKQCTSPIQNMKWCPTYIFKSWNPDTAIQNWKAYKSLVQKYLDELRKTDEGKSATVVKDNTPAYWAKEAVDFATQNGILYGDDKGDYQLRKTCTRQEMLVFLYRLHNLKK